MCERIPSRRQKDVYDWRMHVEFVRAQAAARLAAMESSPQVRSG